MPNQNKETPSLKLQQLHSVRSDSKQEDQKRQDIYPYFPPASTIQFVKLILLPALVFPTAYLKK